MTRVFNGERTFLSPVLRPVERVLYNLAGIDEREEQHWLTYTLAMLVFNLARLCRSSTRLHAAPGRPALQSDGMGAVAPDLAFNTAASFVTNTNWQNYGGESTMSYLVQMAGLTHPELRVGRNGHRARGGADPRLLPRIGQEHRQLLGRHDPRDPLRAAAALRGPDPVLCWQRRSADAFGLRRCDDA